MIKSVSKGKEIAVGVLNEVGILAKITSFLVNHGINIEAIIGSAVPVGKSAALMFITDDNRAAIKILREHGFKQVDENDILIVELEHKPGTLKNISEVLAMNGININYIYSTTCSGGCPAKIILSTSDNNVALALLK